MDESEQFSATEIALVDNEDNQIVRTLRDAVLIASWQKFHSQHAKLRIISSLANLSMARKQPH
jgi:hypothetical protein